MIFFIVAGIAVLADQLLKYWVTSNIALGGIKELIPGVVHITNVHNTGAAFSIFADMRWVLAAVVSVCVVVIVIFLIKSKMSTFGRVTVALVLGGALGNLIDRIVLGYVVDMFEVEFVRFAVFNIADALITVGGITFCIYYIVTNVKHSSTAKQAKPARHVKSASKRAHIDAAPAYSEPEEERQWTEEEILEEYRMSKLLSEDDSDDLP